MLIHAAPLHRNPSIDLPASKSLSNRALILQSLCADLCSLHNLSDCDDTRVMQQAFAILQTTHERRTTIDIGAAGTSMRFLTARLASWSGVDVVLTGSERMRQRPIGILVDALRSIGADITYEAAAGFPPLHIRGQKLRGGELTIDGSISSQYISALLMIAPTLTEGLKLNLTGHVTSMPYIAMTLAMMQQYGVTAICDIDKQIITIEPQPYTTHNYSVESDWSAASYWYEILALASDDDATFTLRGLTANSLQGDSLVARYFAELGVSTTFDADGAVLSKSGKSTDTVRWDLSAQPDLAQTLITTCCALGTHFDIDGLHTLRIKETDRITALETELRKLGYNVTDSLTTDASGKQHVAMHWHGEQTEQEASATIQTYDDHRMAMAFAPLAIVQHNRQIEIAHPEVVNKSYPSYWQHLQHVGFNLTMQ